MSRWLSFSPSPFIGGTMLAFFNIAEIGALRVSVRRGSSPGCGRRTGAGLHGGARCLRSAGSCSGLNGFVYPTRTGARMASNEAAKLEAEAFSELLIGLYKWRTTACCATSQSIWLSDEPPSAPGERGERLDVASIGRAQRLDVEAPLLDRVVGR
jgi:hypothetical protein